MATLSKTVEHASAVVLLLIVFLVGGYCGSLLTICRHQADKYIVEKISKENHQYNLQLVRQNPDKNSDKLAVRETIGVEIDSLLASKVLVGDKCLIVETVK